MGRISLKNIVGKKAETLSAIPSLLDSLKAQVWIEDDKGNTLAGNKTGTNTIEYPIRYEGELLGWVKGDAQTITIGNLMDLLVQKEGEKKKLGTEVLNLYQEINLIFNFSEKLAKTIDAPAICAITLEEATHVIRNDDGVIVLWDEKEKRLNVIASTGDEFFHTEVINLQIPLLSKIIISGQSEIITDTSALVENGIVLPEIQSIIYSALKVKHRVMGAIILASNESVQYTAADLKLLTTLALQSSGAIESALLYEKNIREARESEEAMRKVYEVTGKFVPYEFIGALGHQVITDVQLGEHVEKIVTVLFTDIRDYTTLSENMTPEENFRFVCSFNERMGPIIRSNGGFINQYLGDAIMAIFPGNAVDALKTAIEMRRALEELNTERRSIDLPVIQMGVGMHTGPLIMGITGDHHRLDATTIADTVNTASRIESLTKYYKAGIIISEASYRQLLDVSDFQLRHLGLVQLKGKQEAIGIYECFSGDNEMEREIKMSTLSVFNEGMIQYVNQSYESARKAFQEVIELHPYDRTAAFFLQRSELLLNGVREESLVGVVKMMEK
jgi:class 3 adenylate cyclase